MHVSGDLLRAQDLDLFYPVIIDGRIVLSVRLFYFKVCLLKEQKGLFFQAAFWNSYFDQCNNLSICLVFGIVWDAIIIRDIKHIRLGREQVPDKNYIVNVASSPCTHFTGVLMLYKE